MFSDLNNLEDISLNRNWASLCGITEEELHSGLKPAVEEMAESNGLTYEETLDRLKEMYDGYHFDRDSIGVYNPFSLLNALKNKQFNDYWFETGTPSFLVEMLKRTNYELNHLAHEEQTSDMLNSIDSVHRNPVSLLYQSGYLTIKGYDERFRMYKLGFPNQEVENSLCVVAILRPRKERVNRSSSSKVHPRGRARRCRSFHGTFADDVCR